MRNEELRSILMHTSRVALNGTRCLRTGSGVGARLLNNDKVFINGPISEISCTGAMGNCGCAHAEEQLIIALLRGEISGNVLLTTKSPCITCARLIIASKLINQVVWLYPYRDDSGLRLLRSTGIDVKGVL